MNPSVPSFAAFLICQPLVAVQKMDDAAVRKSVLQKRALHREIVPVGVDLQIREAGIAVRKAKCRNALSVAVFGYRNAVNDRILPVIPPCTVIDRPIGGIVAHLKEEYPEDLLTVGAKIKIARKNIRFYNRGRGMSARPLCHVSRLAHVGAGVAVNFKDCFKIGKGRLSDVHR